MEEVSRYQKGVDMAYKLNGAARGEQVLREMENLSPDFKRYAIEFVLGDIWQRPNLDLRTRSLCNVAALTALGRESQLRLHILGALHNGASKEEIIEVLLQMAAYAGFPAAWDGLIAAKQIFAEYEQANEA